MAEVDNEFAQVVFDFWVDEAIFDARLHKAKFVADVITCATELMGEHSLRFVQTVDGIGQLNFVTGTRLLRFQNRKDFWGQQVAANNG